jgi:CxxC motif-containing protein (DUF1111 family)
MRVLITTVFFVALAALVGCSGDPEATPPLRLVREDPTNLPLRGLTDEEQAGFTRGDVLFDREYLPSQGLGPVYIRTSCASCHARDGRGPGLVERAIEVGEDGFTPLPVQAAMPYGPVLRPYYVAPATRSIDVVAGSTARLLRSVRIGPAVFGRSWMEAIDEAEVVRVAADEARVGRVHGRVPRLADGRLGRFGLKSRVATLEDFAADAFRGDMGLTSPVFPTEVANPDGLTDDGRPGVDLTMDTVRDVGAYVAALAIPRREGLTAEGRAAFERARCSDCHTPSMRTRADARPRVLSSANAEVFTDMLLHDMGRELADGSAEAGAGPRDWRTAPLMGLRHFRSFLHDGRARTLEEAVRLHGGDGSDANDSVAAFDRLSPTDRALLLDYVGRL